MINAKEIELLNKGAMAINLVLNLEQTNNGDFPSVEIEFNYDTSAEYGIELQKGKVSVNFVDSDEDQTVYHYDLEPDPYGDFTRSIIKVTTFIEHGGR